MRDQFALLCDSDLSAYTNNLKKIILIIFSSVGVLLIEWPAR
jgi:hypothetical protein